MTAHIESSLWASKLYMYIKSISDILFFACWDKHLTALVWSTVCDMSEWRCETLVWYVWLCGSGNVQRSRLLKCVMATGYADTQHIHCMTLLSVSLCLLSSVRIYQLFWCPYFVRIQIRPSVSTVTVEQVVRPLPHTWWAVQPIGSSAWQACSNTNDAVTCLAFPPRCSGSGYAEVSQGFVFSGGKFVGSVGTLSAKTPDWPLNTAHYSWHFTPYIKATPQYKSAVLYTTH